MQSKGAAYNERGPARVKRTSGLKVALRPPGKGAPANLFAPDPETAGPATSHQAHAKTDAPRTLTPGQSDHLAGLPIGWLLIVEGPDQGKSFPLFSGSSSVGRRRKNTVSLLGEGEQVKLRNHALLNYDLLTQTLTLTPRGAVVMNGQTCEPNTDLPHGATFRIGGTLLRFVSLRAAGFEWDLPATETGTPETPRT